MATNVELTAITLKWHVGENVHVNNLISLVFVQGNTDQCVASTMSPMATNVELTALTLRWHVEENVHVKNQTNLVFVQ